MLEQSADFKIPDRAPLGLAPFFHFYEVARAVHRSAVLNIWDRAPLGQAPFLSICAHTNVALATQAADSDHQYGQSTA